MAIADILDIGLPNWHACAPKQAPARLCWLRDTPFWVEESAWIGRRVLDCHGRNLGRIHDILIEARSLEEAAGQGETRGVQAVHAAVRLGRSRPWRRSRDVLLPIDSFRTGPANLTVDEDAAALMLTLFGREPADV